MADVLVLQHAESETLGSIADALARRGHRWRYVRAFAGEPVPEQTDAAALVVMGGPMSVYESARHPFLTDEQRLITSMLDGGKPVLGVCLGSQLLASALGARVYRNREMEIGWHPVQLHVELQADPLFGDMGRVFTAFHWHGDVFDLPRGATTLGHSARTFHQGFRYGRKAYGILFHLEVTSELVDRMVGAFPDELREAGLDARTIVEGKAAHLAGVQAIGARVFDAWAGLVS
jgi:GMP synthase (glutamine-hydrolysing)